jgi:hypothetical protein
MRYLIVSVILLFISSSCGTKKETNQKPLETEVMAQNAIIGEPSKDNPTTEISNAEVDGNMLKLTVSYSGGCEEQVFDLVGNEMVMKSFPPKRAVTLVRDSKGDACREYITKELLFDLTELSYQKKNGSEIILLLQGFDKEIRYVFQGEE